MKCIFNLLLTGCRFNGLSIKTSKDNPSHRYRREANHMRLWQRIQHINIITVGTKVLFGVALATNIFIGALVYFNMQSSETIKNTVDDVLTIRENLSVNLREKIFELQKEFVELPTLFESNPQQQIIDIIKERSPVADTETLEGRSNYARLFSRSERRDISKGKVIVQNDNGKTVVAYGIVDGENTFSDTVVRLNLQQGIPSNAAEEISEIITTTENEQSSGQALRQKVLELNAMTADTALGAEKTRNEILQHVDSITAKENLLADVRRQQKELTMYMGLIAILANMLILFFLIRQVIERPLSSLTTTIDEIQRGNFPEIPQLNRRDQIGVLADAVYKFRQALQKIHAENERKNLDKQAIDKTVATAATMINDLESQATQLVALSHTLQTLAEKTGTRAEKVSNNAKDTTENTDQVSASAVELEGVVNRLNTQVGEQENLLDEIITKNTTSQNHVKDLGQAVKEIDGIITLVRDITEQTQLLALNATIEAARAGEAGKGFSIVATEMKELSTRTQQAASDILYKVDAITEAGETLTRNFNEVEGYLTNLNEITIGISGGIEQQNLEVNTITALAAKTSSNTHIVSSTIQQVTRDAGETSELSHRVHEHADGIAAQLTLLLEETTTKLQQVQEQKPNAPAGFALINTKKEGVSLPRAA